VRWAIINKIKLFNGVTIIIGSKNHMAEETQSRLIDCPMHLYRYR
jgi:hypothetical protein